ncbi:unnamed protein product [[Candida] boidinii]|uniref:Small nuclear ribonucleoprotein Sm D2 n=1 Tax=Candida boidinii TaxID=5477 RepID=A0A9W6T7I1_CANBO|nr:hypothetical protein B5S27_g5551 [[Candida] boidinii]OWB69742.1 hypothetical protein B5S30_g5171 [[Candida] boidinii]OWB86186.1 hypothetical protein B5S33_g4868 [[Candida] boidinii]GME79396.1 unnamed protein product [[Candida] boidinii]GMF04659.1 unnamed protein product [[Candida] boidinii]
MAELLNKPKFELSESELQDLEEYEFNHGPLRILTNAIHSRSSVIISLRNNHKLIATVKAFDRHCNMILENVKELWFENSANSSSNKKILRERFTSKMFLRGDSVIVVLKNDN